MKDLIRIKELAEGLEGKNLFDAEVYNEYVWFLFCEITEGIHQNIVNPSVNVLDVTTVVQIFLNNQNVDITTVLLELNEPIVPDETIKIGKATIVPITEEERLGESYKLDFTLDNGWGKNYEA